MAVMLHVHCGVTVMHKFVTVTISLLKNGYVAVVSLLKRLHASPPDLRGDLCYSLACLPDLTV
jgi:hypothetical protein